MVVIWYDFGATVFTLSFNISVHVADPPRVTIHPQELRDVVEGKSAKFSIQATGKEPLNYKWEWKSTGEEGRAKQWQKCHAKWCIGTTLMIPKVDKSNEGSYRCVVSNNAGSHISNPATLTLGKSTKIVIYFHYKFCVSLILLYFYHSTYKHVAELPRITTHPQKLKDAIPGDSATFTVQATGTEPLNYNWQWKPAEKGGGSKEWKPCNEEWSDGFSLTIPNVQKPNEGSYCCVISNHAGTEISKAAPLSVGKKPMHDL